MGIVVAIVATSLFALVALAVTAAAGVAPAGVGLTLALLPIPLLMAGVVYIDRLEPEPPGRLAFVFGCGVVAAALLGLISSAAGTDLLTTPALRSGGFAAAPAGTTIGAAVVEETLKGAILVGLLLARREEIDGAHDGVVYASMVGLGFALIDNIYYYTQASHYGYGEVAGTFVLRGALAPLCQSLFTAAIGVAVAVVANSSGRRGIWLIGGGWALAVAMHGLWDASLTAGPGSIALGYLVVFCLLLVLFGAVVVDRRRIVALIVRYLPEYESADVVTADDVAMLSSLPDRRQARQWARLHGGIAGMREMSEFQLAATELGLVHRRAERGLIGPEAFAQRRDGLLDGMRAATAAFLARLSDPPRPPWAAGGTSCFRPHIIRTERPPARPEAGRGEPGQA